MATSKILKDVETVYSTEETVIGTWTNGKPIYRKVFSNHSFGATERAWTNTGVVITDVEQLLDVKATTASSVAIPIIPMMGFRISNNNLQYYVMIGWQNIYDVTVEYTKATD